MISFVIEKYLYIRKIASLADNAFYQDLMKKIGKRRPRHYMKDEEIFV